MKLMCFNNKILIKAIILGLLFINICGCEKILFFFAGGSYSHKLSVWPWTVALAEQGHDVTFISGFEKSPSDDPSHCKIRDLSSPTLFNLMSKSYDVDRFQERERGDFKRMLTGYTQISTKICETTLLKSENDQVLQNLWHNETFDLVIINIIYGECGFAFAHRYNAKTIVYDASVTLSWFYDLYGFQGETSWIPDVLGEYENIPMSLLDRVKNTIYLGYWYWDRYNYLTPEYNRIMKDAFGRDDIPSLYEMERNVSLLIINSHYSCDFANSLPPLAVQIGGLNAFSPEKPIPEKYLKFMDEAGPGGVVFISFGSTIRLEKIPQYYSRIFFQVVKKHKNVRFLMKWNGPYPKEYETGLDNLLTSDWLEQRELLRHPKLRGFVSHGGLNSIQEATYYGVPMIVLPLFVDQDYNAYRIEAQKVGFRLEIRGMTFSKMDDAITKILTDNQYKNNMEVKSKFFRDRPQSPIDTVVYWTEFVLRNDDFSALKPMNSHLTWYQRRLLDVYLVYGVAIFVPLIFLCIFFVKLGKRVFNQKVVDIRNHVSSSKTKITYLKGTWNAESKRLTKLIKNH